MGSECDCEILLWFLHAFDEAPHNPRSSREPDDENLVTSEMISVCQHGDLEQSSMCLDLSAEHFRAVAYDFRFPTLAHKPRPLPDKIMIIAPD